nr:MAG TPA: hypothetical protein [Caudoviricetes sp.]
MTFRRYKGDIINWGKPPEANRTRGVPPPRGDEFAPSGDSDIFTAIFHIIRVRQGVIP